MRRSIILIIPYFGSFPNYFELWLQSCRNNPTISWLLITDNESIYNYPPNVIIHRTTFEATRALFQKNFDFPILLDTPYKFCDFKPTYGVVFSEFIKEYDFWGFCDMDLIWGDLREFLTSNMLETYSKISWRGHFTIFKNIDEINKIFKHKDLFKTIFQNPTTVNFAFDENEANIFFEEKGLEIFKGLYFADLKTCTNNFEMMHFSDSFQVQNKHQIFEYCKGKLIRHYILNGLLYEDEMMYIHFLKRPMSIDNSFNNFDHFLIIPNRFTKYEDINIEKVLSWSKKRIYFTYYFERLNWKYYKKRKASLYNLKKFSELFGFLHRKEFINLIK